MTTDTTCNNCTGICSCNLVEFCNLIAFALEASSKVNEYMLFWTGNNLLLAGRELLDYSLGVSCSSPIQQLVVYSG